MGSQQDYKRCFSFTYSIPEAISAAITLKNVKHLLLVVILIIPLINLFTPQTIHLKDQETKGLRYKIGDELTDNQMVAFGFYYAVRFGNVDAQTMNSVIDLLKRTLPVQFQEKAIIQSLEILEVISETGVKERFIPEKIDIHREMGKVWVIGKKVVEAPNTKPKKVQAVREYIFAQKRGFVYPTFSDSYAGGSRAQQQINDYIQSKEEK